MGRLQELFHDDEGPTQNSAGLTRDRNWPMEIDENRISLYEGPSKTTDIPRRLLSTNSPTDPIERLPPELATLFIQNTLPSHTRSDEGPGRSSRLIELTGVSKKWQGFLCSTPILWSELLLDERQGEFLTILSVFVTLSGKVALRLTFPREPADWTGLASMLLPVTQRITSLAFLGHGVGVSWISSIISTIFARLGHLPHLNEVNFDKIPGTDDLLRTASLLLPSTIKIDGLFWIEIPESCWKSGTPGRFFDITKYNAFTNLEPIGIASNSLNLQYCGRLPAKQIAIHSNDATLSHLQSLAGRLAEHNCFEQLVCRTTPYVQHLDINIRLSQVQDVIDCLRLLMRLQRLVLEIQIEDSAKNFNWPPNNATCLDLRLLSVFFRNDDVPGILLSAQRTLRNLFSAFETLYPSVEDFHFNGHTWPFFASSYLRSLRALKSLSLHLEDSKHNPPEGSINLHSLQYLKIEGPVYLDSLDTPNLLKLSLDLPKPEAWPAHLSHPHIRSLVIGCHESTRDFKVLPLDCSDLHHLRLDDIPLRAIWGLLSLSNVVSITLKSGVAMAHSSSNQLCLALLCNPERLPSLQQLHFNNTVDWDVLFLMLQRRNFDQIGAKRIDTVTLPFIPFTLQRHLVCLLAAKSMELPSLVSLSLEATREVLFDSTIPGCFACLHSMRPGCTLMAVRRTDLDEDILPPEDIYPVEDIAVETVPAEIRDWLSLRSNLLDIWRASYDEFSQEFSRGDACEEFRAL